MLEVEDVDDEPILVEPRARVGSDAGRGCRRRQSTSLDGPAGRADACGTRETDDDAQERPAHVEGRYPSIMS
jgi:hypothetical protein